MPVMRFDCLYKLWHIEQTTFLITSILTSSNIGKEYVFAQEEGDKICKMICLHIYLWANVSNSFKNQI